VYNQCTFHSYTKIIIATSLINDGLLLCDDPAITSPGPGMEKIEINGAATLTNNKTVVGSEFLNSGMVTGNNGRFYFSNITTNSSTSANFNGTNLNFFDASSSGNVLDNGAAGAGVSRVFFLLPDATLLTSSCGNIYSVLALKLLNFNAIADDNYNVIISWEVDNESTSGNYEIQRSSNGITFSKVTDITTAAYKIEKVLPAELHYGETIYYRLKMTDASGIVSYSKIVPVYLKNSAKTSTRFYPNPVADNLYITSTAAAYTIDIFTANGLQIKSIKVENAGRFSIDFSKEAKGFYFIKFTYSDGSVVNQKIVKQ
jgi:Secretion system C-terminal sorting domain